MSTPDLKNIFSFGQLSRKKFLHINTTHNRDINDMTCSLRGQDPLMNVDLDTNILYIHNDVIDQSDYNLNMVINSLIISLS